MQTYKLRKVDDNLQDLAKIFIMPLFFGGVAVTSAWQDPFWSWLGIILISLSLLSIIILYLNSESDFAITIEKNEIIFIKSKTGKIWKRVNISDIALIKFDKSTDAVSLLASQKGWLEKIKLFSNEGKIIFTCINSAQEAEFQRFFIDLRTRMDAYQQSGYVKRIRLIQLRRYYFINPQYKDSRVVKKLLKEGGFYYPLIIFLIGIIIFMIIMNLVNVIKF